MSRLYSPASLPTDWRRSWIEEYPCDLPSEVPYPRVPLTALLNRAARRHPKHVACTLYGHPTTYADLAHQARRLACALRELGATRGRYVGLLLPNIPEYLVAIQAIWQTGATALQLSPLMVAEEIQHWLEATGCRVVITLDLLAPAVTASFDRGPLEHLVETSLVRRMAMWQGLLYRIERFRRNGYRMLAEDARRHRFDALLRHDPLDEEPDIDPTDDVAVLAPTGGTTASPKAVMLTHRNLVANALQLRYWLGGEDATLSDLAVLPFFHAYGLTVSLLTMWASCGTVHLHPRFETRAVLSLLQEARPTLLPAVPAMLAAMNKQMGDHPIDLSFIRHVISGASALAQEVRDRFARTGVGDIVEGYGLTEASPVTHVNQSGTGNRPGTIGRPLPDTETRLVDPDTGLDVPTGAVGELWVRGPQVMKGYLNNPLATDEVLRDGWLHTGDLARCDAEGQFNLVDRKRDIIKTSGYLVYPAEVEEVLCSHPDVSEAAVIGVPDRERGELIKALVVPRSGQQVDVFDLEEFCRLHLSRHKRPRLLEVVPELPRNFLGKILRRKLREEFSALAPHLGRD